MAFKKIEIVEVAEKTTESGNKFNAYKTLDDKGHKIDLKFNRSCKNPPETTGFIYVPDGDWNKDSRGRYPVVWIKSVAAFEHYTPKASTGSGVAGETVETLPF